MHKSVFLLIFLCAFLSAEAQNERIYYDEQWQVTKKRKADWYREYTLQVPDNIIKIEDHYIDGPLYKTGYQTTIQSNSCMYRVGPIVFYDREGHKLREGQYKNGIRTGTWKYYYRGTDVIRYECHYAQDTGEHMDYALSYDSATHKLKYKTVYLDSNKTLIWNYTATDSTFREITDSSSANNQTKIKQYKDLKAKNSELICYNENGEIIPCDTILQDSSHQVYSYVRQMPRAKFDMLYYLMHNLHYPKQAIKENTEGRVLIKFVVDEDGAIANPKIFKSIGGGCDEDALRVISEMPYWQPGIQNGDPVRVFFTLPIVFKLK